MFLTGCLSKAAFIRFLRLDISNLCCMRGKFIADISANTFQLVVNQCCGLGIFYVLSTNLAKSDFGEINWSLAIMLTLFGILQCGVDQVSVKRIASGRDPEKVLSIYISHVLLWGGILYLLLLAARIIFPAFFEIHLFLLLLALAKLMIFFSTPFKQLASGQEKFRSLLFMNICSNVLRSIALVALLLMKSLDITCVIIVFVAGDLFELITSILITRFVLKVPVRLHWDRSGYVGLLHESLPQLGVAVFTSILSRFDWIYLGLMGTIIVAEYSFAYKVFEMATLPMLVIAPLLVPRFTRMFKKENSGVTVESEKLLLLLRIEMVISSFTGLVLSMTWTPVVDALTAGKYGAVNQHCIFILSASMPFLYLNNYLWTINFAIGKLKMIFYNYAVTVCINIIADCILIPVFKAEGAATGLLMAIAGQAVFYLINTEVPGIRRASISAIICPALAFAAGFVSMTFLHGLLWRVLISILIFFILLLLTRQIRRNDWPDTLRIIGFKGNPSS